MTAAVAGLTAGRGKVADVVASENRSEWLGAGDAAPTPMPAAAWSPHSWTAGAIVRGPAGAGS
jgi:hypothetical protein